MGSECEVGPIGKRRVEMLEREAFFAHDQSIGAGNERQW